MTTYTLPRLKQRPIHVGATLWNGLSLIEKEKLNVACFQLAKIRAFINPSKLVSYISTPWQRQLLTGDTAEIVALLNSPSDNLQDNLGANPYHYLSIRGDLPLLESVKSQFDLQRYLVPNNFGMTIAHFAALSGSTAVLKNVLEKHPELKEVRDNNGRNIAHYAANSGSPAVLNYVLEKHPELKEVRDNNGLNIAHFAALSGSTEALKNVLAKCSELKLEEVLGNDGGSIAHYAALSGSTAVLKDVLEKHPELKELQDNNGCTIAHYAAWSGSTTVLNYVLKEYSGLKSIDTNSGCTIAHYAVASGSSVILPYLLEKEPLLMAKLWIKDKNGNTLDSYSTKYRAKLSATQVLNQCLLAACRRISNSTYRSKDIDLLDVFQDHFLGLVVFDERNNLPRNFYQTLSNIPGLNACLSNKVATLLTLKEIDTKDSILNLTLIETILNTVENAFKSAINRWNFFSTSSTTSFNLITELNRLRQASLQRQKQTDTPLLTTNDHDFITAVQVLIDDAQRFPIAPEFKQVSRLIVEKLSMTPAIMARQPQPETQTPDNANHDNVEERYSAIQAEITTIKANLLPHYHSDVDAMMTAFHELIFARETIKNHFLAHPNAVYHLHPEILLHTENAADVAALEAKLDYLVRGFLDGFDRAKRAGVIKGYFERLATGLCIEGRTENAFPWVTSYLAVQPIDTLMSKFHTEYQAYYKTLYNYSDDKLDDLSLVVDFIIKRYQGFPCVSDLEFAPDGIISKTGIEQYCTKQLGLESPQQNCACAVM